MESIAAPSLFTSLLICSGKKNIYIYFPCFYIFFYNPICLVLGHDICKLIFLFDGMKAGAPQTCPADNGGKCDGSDGWEGEFFPGIPKIKYEVYSCNFCAETVIIFN